VLVEGAALLVLVVEIDVGAGVLDEEATLLVLALDIGVVAGVLAAEELMLALLAEEDIEGVDARDDEAAINDEEAALEPTTLHIVTSEKIVNR